MRSRLDRNRTGGETFSLRGIDPQEITEMRMGISLGGLILLILIIWLLFGRG